MFLECFLVGMFFSVLILCSKNNEGLSKIYINEDAGMKDFAEVREMSGILYDLLDHNSSAEEKTEAEVQYYRIPYYASFSWLESSVCLMNKDPGKKKCRLRPDQCFSVIPDYTVLGDKSRFTELLYDVYPEQKQNEWYYPRSYLLYQKDDRDSFLAEIERLYGPSVFSRLQCCVECYEEEMNNNYTCPLNPDLYIMKCGFLFEGMGMFSIDPNHIDDLFIELYNEHTLEVVIGLRYIAQRYIGELTLYKTRKCHSRKYFLILSVDPLYVISFPTGDTICGSANFSIERGITDPDMLSSNYASHIETGGIVRNLFLIEGWFPDGFLETTFIDETNRIISHLSKLFHHHALKDDFLREKFVRPSNLSERRFPHYSGLFAIDILVDSNLKIWITEVQTMGKLYPCSPDIFNCTESNLFNGRLSLEILTILAEFCSKRVHAENNNEEFSIENLESIKNAMWIIKGGEDLYPEKGKEERV